MKILKTLHFNPENLLKNEELLTLKGGYGSAYCACKKGSEILCFQVVENCGENYGSCIQWCNYYCPDFEYSLCS